MYPDKKEGLQDRRLLTDKEEMTEAETVILLQHRKSGDVVIEAQTVGQRV
jgi:hypothetical protein